MWEKWGEDRGVVAKECEQYAVRLVGYAHKRRDTNGMTAVNSAYYGRRTMNFSS